MKTIIVNKSDRDNVSINFANNKNIFITFRNKIYNELKINSTFDLINAHKFTDKYNIFEGCKVIDISFIENTTRIKCSFECIKTITEKDILAKNRKDKLNNINGTIQ